MSIKSGGGPQASLRSWQPPQIIQPSIHSTFRQHDSPYELAAGPNFYSLGRDTQRREEDSDTFATTLPLQGYFRVKHKIAQNQHQLQDTRRNTQPPLVQVKKFKLAQIPVSRTTVQGSPRSKMLRPRTAQGVKPPLGMNFAVNTQRAAQTPNNHD
jgi:hypothetical protein